MTQDPSADVTRRLVWKQFGGCFLAAWGVFTVLGGGVAVLILPFALKCWALIFAGMQLIWLGNSIRRTAAEEMAARALVSGQPTGPA